MGDESCHTVTYVGSDDVMFLYFGLYGLRDLIIWSLHKPLLDRCECNVVKFNNQLQKNGTSVVW